MEAAAGWTRTPRTEPARYSRPMLDQMRKCESLIKALKPLSDTLGPPVKGRQGRQGGAPLRQLGSPRRARALAGGLPLSATAPLAAAVRSPPHGLPASAAAKRAQSGFVLPRSMSEPLGARPRRLDPLKHTPRGTPLDHPVLLGAPARCAPALGSSCPSASSTPSGRAPGSPQRPGPLRRSASGPGPGAWRSPKASGHGREGAPGRAAEARSEEALALQQITSISRRISDDLTKVQRSCKVFAELRGAEDSDMERSALSQISSATYRVCDALAGAKGEEEGRAEEGQAPASWAPETPYDDPLLARARALNAVTNRLCDDLAVTCRNISTTRHDDQVSSLQEISTVTLRVCRDMSLFQEGFTQALGAERHPEEGGAGGGPRGGAELPEASNGAAPEADAEPEGPQAGDGAAAAQPTSPWAACADGDLQELLERLASHANGFDGFTEKEEQRLRSAFQRFKVPDSADLHKDDLEGLLRYLGHVMTEQEGLMPLVQEVTSYDYLDFDEFLSFMEKYVVYEREQFHRVFNRYDEDDSGEISLQELRHLTSALGFATHWVMVVEALSIVSADVHGQLTFDQLVAFLAVYRHSEGFTRAEVAELRRQFEHFAERGAGDREAALQAESLSDALVQVFGLQVADSAARLAQELQSGGGMQASPLGARSGDADGIRFPEFLIFARKVREAENELYHSKYPQWGTSCKRLKVSDLSGDGRALEAGGPSGSGGICLEELRKVLQELEYTPLSQVVDEVLSECIEGNWTPERELDFDEFFDFMLLFRQRDGFSKAEVEEMRQIFGRFDADGSGEIAALELSDLLRHLGYSVALEDIHCFVAAVDANGSNDLDFREFLRLMRLYREAELGKVRGVFNSLREPESSDRLPLNALAEALEALDHEPPGDLPTEGATEQQGLDFDEFVALVDRCRADLVARQRKRAGFNDQEIGHFRELFEQIDRDKSGEIDPKELLLLLKEFNWEPKTREEQAALLRKLDLARAAAREAEVDDVSADGAPSIRFWEFVQLARMLRSQHDRAHEDAMARLMEELKFTQQEVDQFRQVFRSWSRRDNVFEGGAGESTPDMLPRDVVRRLVRSLGVSITPENKGRLDEKLATLDEGGLLDFVGFLRLMRWLTDTNFAGVNEAAAKKT